jgi:hypothetical protein
MLGSPFLESLKVSALMNPTHATNRWVSRAMYFLSESVEAMRDMGPRIKLFTSTVVLVDTRTDDGL